MGSCKVWACSWSATQWRVLAIQTGQGVWTQEDLHPGLYGLWEEERFVGEASYNQWLHSHLWKLNMSELPQLYKRLSGLGISFVN